MRKRPRRIVPAVIVSATLIAAGVLVAIAGIDHARDGGNGGLAPLRRFAVEASWNAPIVLAGSTVLLAIGLVLLCCGLVPGRAAIIRIDQSEEPALSAADRLEVGVARRGLVHLLRSAALEVDGVRTARVRMRGRSVTVVARTPLRDTRGLDERVRARVRHRLDQVRPVSSPAVKVHTVAARSRP